MIKKRNAKLGIAAMGGVLVLAFATAAMSQQPGASAAASRKLMQNRASSSADEALYVEKCSMCHREQGMGTVLLQRRGDKKPAMLEQRGLPAQYIVTVARRGMLNMPPIPRGEVSDEQLGRIAQYLSKGRAQ